jgi:hypothetical protein
MILILEKNKISNMKKILFGTLIVTALFSSTSCVKVYFEDETVAAPPADSTSNVIAGKITTSRFYARGIYILKGYVYVTEGATLTFEAGSIIKSDITEKGALIIERGAKLIADGTASNPIVFTSGKAAGQRAPGDWGGIILLGKAPTNRPLDPAPTIEGGVGRQFGGTDPLDESGIIRYVRIEYAGIAAEPGSEINGLTCGGVGSGTILDHIQVTYGNDDAYEFFGGTVNAKYLFAFATADDDFDFDFGYTGKIQFAVSSRNPEFVDAGDAGNGIECDNDGSGTTATPVTRPQLSNFTIIGPDGATGTAANHNYSQRWRRRTQFVLRNSIMIGHPKGGFTLESDGVGQAYKDGLSEFKNNLVHATTNPYWVHLNSGTPSVNPSIITPAEMKTKAESEGCITYTNSGDIQIENTTFGSSFNPMPKTGSPALSGSSFTGMNTFFTSTTYRGAFGTTNWLANWTELDPQNKNYQ